MRRIRFAVVALALAAGLTASQSIAQNAQQGAQGGGGNRPPPGPPHTMDLASAKKLVAAAEAAATALNDHVAICVMDTNGDVVLSERMDGLRDRVPLSTSQGKARAVLIFGIPTGQIADAQRDKKPITAMITTPTSGDLTVMRGGLPIMKDGKMVGSIGVGGSATESDEKYAQAGIDALQSK
jgi:glc operon protein GlcG